jgi:putative Ca2+/H+ antiporter (TMEM165/GDT1 family)
MSLQLFFTVYGIIFIAELPDKTALAALALATRHRPLPVFLGAALALAAQSLIAVAAGSLLARLPVQVVRIGAGALFLVCAAVMWLRKVEEPGEPSREPRAAGFWSALWTVFLIIFVAELGDLTQLGTASLQAKYGAWLTVFAASTLALWSVAGLAVAVGNRAARLLAPHVTQKVAAIVFAAAGVLLVAGVF